MQHFYCRPKGTSIKILCQEVSWLYGLGFFVAIIFPQVQF
jgi:hypothetical protein